MFNVHGVLNLTSRVLAGWIVAVFQDLIRISYTGTPNFLGNVWGSRHMEVFNHSSIS